MNHPTRARAALIAAAVAALALLPAAPASAHDELLKADPADGATVTSLTEVGLTFAEPLVDLGGHRNGITVTDGAGRHFETACAKVDGDDLVAPVALGAAGEYRVQWRGVADDGHVIGATYSFTYAPASGAAEAAGSASGPSCGATGAVSTAASSGTGIDGGAIATGAIAGGAVLIVAGVVLLLVLRSRRPEDADESAATDTEAGR